ncbi:MAG: hypothetical protein ABJA93_02160 [Sporichthyaceae bacterium]
MNLRHAGKEVEVLPGTPGTLPFQLRTAMFPVAAATSFATCRA